MKPLFAAAATGLALSAWPAAAADVTLTVEIAAPSGPRWHRPYVAVWLQRAQEPVFVADLAVWYDLRKRGNGGTKWLSDLRHWWRASGSQAALPIDGVTGATRGAGEQVLALGQHPALAALAPGAYEVVVEAAREHGGHELLRLPLSWPPKAPQDPQVRGSAGELQAVRLTVKP